MKNTLTIISITLCQFLAFGQDINQAEALIEGAKILIEEEKLDSALLQLQIAKELYKEEENWEGYYQSVKNITEVYSIKENGIGASTIQEEIIFLEAIGYENKENMGDLYLSLSGIQVLGSNHHASQLAVEKALENYQMVLPNQHLKILSTYSNFAVNFIESGQYQKAKTYLKKSIPLETSPSDTAQALINHYFKTHQRLGILYKELNETEQAIKHYKKALNFAKELDDLVNIGVTNYNMGYAYLQDLQIENALSYLHLANQQFIEAFGEVHPYVSASYNLLSVCYGYLDKNTERQYLEKALYITQELYHEEHVRVGIMYLNLGVWEAENMNHDSSLKYYYRAKHLFEKLLPNAHPHKTRTYYSILDQYAHLKSIDSLFYYADLLEQESIDLYGENNSELTACYSSKAYAYLLQGQFDKALENISKSHNVNAVPLEFSEKNKQFFQPKAAINAYLIQAQIYFERWKAMQKSEDWEETMKSMEAIHDLVYQFSLDEKRITLNTQLEYEDVFIYLMKYLPTTKDSTVLDQISLWLFRKKSQQLLTSFNASRAEKNVGMSSIYLEKDKKINKKIFSEEQRIKDLVIIPDSLEAAKRASIELAQLYKERVELKSKIQEEYPNYFELKYAQNPPQISELQDKLSQDEILLNFSLNTDSLFSLVLLVDKEKVSAKELTITKDTPEKIKQLNTLLKAPLFRTDKRKAFIKLAHELYNTFLAPIKGQFEDKKRLVIIADAETHYIPFEVLLKSGEEKAFADLDFLLNDFEISYHYSGALFARSRETIPQNQEGLLAFAPVFSKELESSSAPVDTWRSYVDSTYTAYRAVDEEGSYTPLLNSLEEVNTISKMVDATGKRQAIKLLFGEATEENLKELIKESYRFVHIASHSFANLKQGKYSGIACAPNAQEESTEDGTLYVGEVYNLDIPADLVVLSSCESGLGELQNGEGLIGLNRSFIYAGVPNVIFSLWKVNDKVSSELMINFYREVLNGADYAGALRKAKLQLLEKEETASPNLWSSFLLIGR